jgi:hypothetical protein
MKHTVENLTLFIKIELRQRLCRIFQYKFVSKIFGNMLYLTFDFEPDFLKIFTSKQEFDNRNVLEVIEVFFL